MANPFLSSEEYDERAHRLYDAGDYEAALDTLREGLRLYPHSVELHVGLGYTRLAREEFVWAKHSFEHALVLDGEHEDALVGLGEALLRFGRQDEALELFGRARDTGCADDLDLLLSMGRALYRERLFEEAKEVFIEAASLYRDSSEAAAALGYTFHRMNDETAARRELRRSLHLDSEHHEARIYLAHMLYDANEWSAALEEFERVPIHEQFDSLAVFRLIELKRALPGLPAGSASIAAWESRLEELDDEVDELDDLLALLQGDDSEGPRRKEGDFSFETHRVRLPDGRCFSGSWLDIVRQIRDVKGFGAETVAQFMRRHFLEELSRSGIQMPDMEPEQFLHAGARAGHWRIET